MLCNIFQSIMEQCGELSNIQPTDIIDIIGIGGQLMKVQKVNEYGEYG